MGMGCRDAVTNPRRPLEMLLTPRQESEPYTMLGGPLEGQMVQQAHLCSSICRHVFCGLPGNSYIFSSWRSGVFSSCCLALDSSSSFPCPAFRAIAKSGSDANFLESQR
ncbi:hypothetical protein STEG23_030957 [Scotinomys teguina]